MKHIPVGVLGCTGIVGQQFVRMLEKHPYFDLALLAASSRSAGKKYGEAQPWVVDGEIPHAARDGKIVDAGIEPLAASGVRVFFSALPPSAAGPIESELRERGCFVFSNASSHRKDDDVPILIPEVNPGHIAMAERQATLHRGFIIAGSNCSTSGLVMALKPLESFGLQSVSVTTFQSMSGAGRRGIAALDIAGNVIPFIRSEEEKMERETRKILGTLEKAGIRPCDLGVRASCCRVPVREGHLLSIDAEFGEAPDAEAVREAIARFRGVPQQLALPTAPVSPVILRTEEDRPQPQLDVRAGSPARARGMAVSVGRLRFKGRRLSLFALVHNTIRGAAGTCLLNAELAVAKSLIS